MEALLFSVKERKLRFLEFEAFSFWVKAEVKACLESTFSVRMFEYKMTRFFIKFKIMGCVLNSLHSVPLFKFIK